MRRVRRDEIVDYATYEDQRDEFRAEAMAAKETRRVHLGEHLTLLFENTLTVHYQIQEMIRAERIVREADIQHEVDTYNDVLGGEGELACTLLVEIEDRKERDERLRHWYGLPERLYLRLEDGKRIRPTFDERQRGDSKLSSVQYLKFPVEGRVPVAAGVDLKDLEVETPLTDAQRRSLAEDLGVDLR